MNHNEAPSSLESPTSLESEWKNYKSLYEEIAQNDSKIYLNSSISDDIIRFVDDDPTQCCCCRVHRRQNSFIAGGAVTKPFNIPIYNTIWVGEMKNATDYIEYLNKKRRNSFNSLNKDNRSNYYKLMLSDNISLTNNDYEKQNNNSIHNDDNNNNINDSSGNFLQVPKLHVDEHLRRTPEFEDISKKIDQIQTLDSNVSSLIYKSIEVHADILSLDATVSRLLAETRKLLEDLEDVKCLDEVLDMLNTEIPIIHREWMYPITNSNKIPVDEGIMVSSLNECWRTNEHQHLHHIEH